MSKKLIYILLGVIFVGAIASVICFFLMKKEITLSHDNLIMYTGYTKEIYLKNYDGACEWQSLNPEIATVSDGNIVAIKPGETLIICKTEEKEYICELSIYEPISEEYRKLVEEDVEWLESLQLEDGSFSCYEIEENVTNRVNPYFATYAAIAILRTDYDNQKSDKIEHFMEWYFSHMNMKEDVKGSIGTVYDYQVSIKNGHIVKEESTGQYDSSDSYAAMFLTLLSEYLEKYNNHELLLKEKEKIDIIVDLLLLLQKDDYTESKNGSNVKYLMNNMESYQGFKSALKLYKKLWNDDKRVMKLEKAIEGFESSFNEMWKSETYYYPVLNGENESFYGDKMDWNNLYVYAVPQLFPVIFGMADSKDEFMQNVYSKFCENWDWTNMEFNHDESSANQTWSLIAYAAMKMEDSIRVDSYLEHYQQTIQDRSFPFYTGDSVWFVLTCDAAYDFYSQNEKNGILHPQYDSKEKN